MRWPASKWQKRPQCLFTKRRVGVNTVQGYSKFWEGCSEYEEEETRINSHHLRPTRRLIWSRRWPSGFWKQLYKPLLLMFTSIRMSRGPSSRRRAFTSVPFTFHVTEASLSSEPHCIVTSLPILSYWILAPGETESSWDHHDCNRGHHNCNTWLYIYFFQGAHAPTS